MRKMLTTAVAALSLLAMMISAHPCFAGMVTLSFDDGLISVYTEALPVLKKYRFPATVGIVLSRLTSKTGDYMDTRQALELQKNGWEVASHGLTHKRPTEIPAYFSNESITGWEPDEGLEGVYSVKYHFEAIAGLLENGEQLRAVGSVEDVAKSPGTYYFDPLISQLHLQPLQPENPDRLDVRAISYQRELADSKKGLEKLGFKVTTYVTPYNYWTPEMAAISRYYYEQVADGGESANFRGKIDPHWLKRIYMHTMSSPEEVMRRIQRDAVEKDGWVILCFHGIEGDLGWEPWSAEKLDTLASWLHEQKIRVVTISEGVPVLNNTAK